MRLIHERPVKSSSEQNPAWKAPAEMLFVSLSTHRGLIIRSEKGMQFFQNYYPVMASQGFTLADIEFADVLLNPSSAPQSTANRHEMGIPSSLVALY
jgi:hypothetical protein